MISQIEKEREDLLRQLNNLCRSLSPADALYLNRKLAELIELVTSRGRKEPSDA